MRNCQNFPAVTLTSTSLCLLLLGNPFSNVHAQALSDKTAAALRHVFTVDCAMAEGKDPLAKFKNVYEALDSSSQAEVNRQLRSLLEQGPSGKDLDRFERSLKRQWENRAAFMKQRPRLALKAEYLELAMNTKEADFLAQRRAQFVLRQRTRAAHAIAATGSPAGVKRLKELRDSLKDEEALREAIGAALARFEAQSKKKI
jgi:hypothetical protein